jgi:hypothetical protein
LSLALANAVSTEGFAQACGCRAKAARIIKTTVDAAAVELSAAEGAGNASIAAVRDLQACKKVLSGAD